MATSKKMLAALGLSLALVALPQLEGVMLKDYLDPVGIPTACMGHTATAVVGKVRTLSECYGLMYDDVMKHYKELMAVVKVPLAPHQLSALVLFHYNVGAPSFNSSTLLRLLNAGDYAGASKQFGRWVYATEKGRKIVLPGLVKRRNIEARMFNGQVDLDMGKYEALPDRAEEGPEPAPEPESRPAPAQAATPWWRSLLGPSTIALR